VAVYFDRDQPAAADKSPLLLRHAGSGKSLDEEPIRLAINDVVTVEVEARGPGRFPIDQWQRVEAWKETRKSGKKKTETTTRLPQFLSVEGSLGKGIFLGLTFPEDREKNLTLKEGANPPRVVDRPGTLSLVGVVDRGAPSFTQRTSGSRWETEPQRVRLANRTDVPWYTLTVTIRR
jgi:hypothetical protein